MHYKIIEGSGSSGLMCPPGHPNHHYSAEGYASSRSREPQSIGPLSSLLEDSEASDAIRRQAEKIINQAKLVPSELWIRNVYGYYKTMYVPESGDRDVSGLISHTPYEEVADAARKGLEAAGFERGDNLISGGNGHEVRAAQDASAVFVYHKRDGERVKGAGELLDYIPALEAAGFTNVTAESATEKHTTRIKATPPYIPSPYPAERHGAVACIRKYFPDHEPRTDLIENPGKGYGSYPCDKCGERVQYEARLDALAIVNTRVIPGGMTRWSYEPKCSDGGQHKVD